MSRKNEKARGGGREGGRKGGRKEGREGGRMGGREGGREGGLTNKRLRRGSIESHVNEDAVGEVELETGV